MINVTADNKDNVVIAFVEGRVDSTNAAEFEEKLVAVDTGEKLVIDIQNLEYISSAGLRAILKFRKKHADLEIVNANTEVYEIFDMTGFTDMMTVKKAYRIVSVEGCEVIGKGANGEVYRIDPDTVVKVYLNDDSLDAIEHERDVARKALVLGIPTAISYDVVKVGEHYASMFEMINAKSFAKLLVADPDGVDGYAKMYVDLLKLIHSTDVPKGQLPDQREVALRWIADCKDALPKLVFDKLQKMIEEVPYSDKMIHGDYHVKNVMLQNDEVILIDMDTLAVGHPILEFGSIYNAYLGFSALDHSATKSFMGIDYEVGSKLWRRTLEYYYETTDEAELDYRENQAKIVGLIRLLRRTMRRNGDPAFIEYCKTELCKLAETVDTLL
ncbi:MAG: phosphotransferase [Clostridia bacterium]|nr:phosphotransferase [Clostridia bacterium]